MFMLLTLCKGWEDCSPACMYPMMGGEWIQGGGSFCLFACLFVFLNEKKVTLKCPVSFFLGPVW